MISRSVELMSDVAGRDDVGHLSETLAIW
jgi:hypothetical protein